MVTLNNPSVEFCRIKDPVKVVRFLEKVNQKIGYFEDSKGEIVDLRLETEGDAKEWNPGVGRFIQTAHRGFLVKEERESIQTRPPRIQKTYYPMRYYGIESTRGNFILLVGKKKASQILFRVLRSNKHDVRRVNLGRTIQDKLCQRKDMFYYASSVDDEVEERAGKLKVYSSSTDTPLKGVKIDAIINGRGRNRDQGITWRESNVRPKIVFWINREGRLSIKRMEISEPFFLELMDIILGVL